jgi:hypothetical protein
MQLQCADVLDVLRNRPIMTIDAAGMPVIANTNHVIRKNLLLPLLPQIHQAKKFIFDSGSDQDETAVAVRQTAVAMMEAKLFHQPHPVIWIEDPYDNDPDLQRNFYLGIETPGKITVFAFNRSNVNGMYREMFGETPPAKVPTITFHPFPLEIDLENPSDDFRVTNVGLAFRRDSIEAKVLGEAIYSYKKLIVTLNTSNHKSEYVMAPPRKAAGVQRRFYDHHIIRIPIDYEAPIEPSGPGLPGRPRRMHLVRGYVYGKNTRPLAEQRWVKPYWRGDKELGVVATPEHYEVR